MSYAPASSDVAGRTRVDADVVRSAIPACSLRLVTAWSVVALVVGLVSLVLGAELLVKGASAIATRLGVAPVIIGLTVVAFGTSAPEFAVSIGATVTDSPDVALGNVVGSNIGNVLLILGITAVLGGLAVSQRIVRLDLPWLIIVSVVVYVMALDNSIGRLDGVVLVVGIVAYTMWLIRAARAERSDIVAEYREAIDQVEGAVVERGLGVQIGFFAAGLAVLVVGSRLLVGSATDIAESFGVSDLVIGLTVVAIGTSLPELATSVLAVLRGQRDIAVGNVVGSNLFNLLGVLGVSGVVAGDGVAVSDGSLRLDLPVMLAATIVLLPIFWNGFEIRRWEGVVLVAAYALYIAYLVLDAGDHDATDVVGPASLLVASLVGLTLIATGIQGWRRHRAVEPAPDK